MTWLCESGDFICHVRELSHTVQKILYFIPPVRLVVTRVSRTRRHIPCGGPGGVVLSEHRGGGLVQDGHGDLLRVVILLPSLVVLADRLAERVSVRNFVKIRSVIITSGQNAGIGVLTCSEYCDLVLSFSLVRVGEFQGFLIGPTVLLDPE